MRGELQIVVIALASVGISCSQPEPAESAAEGVVSASPYENISASAPQKRRYHFTDPGFILEDHKHKFHTGRIEIFDENFLDKRHADSLYPVLDRESFDVFQSNEKVYDRIDEGTPYYYAVQYTGHHTGIVIRQMNDAWVNRYIYLAYNLNGKLMGTAILAGAGGDGGYVTVMTGQFINDSVFVKSTIETEQDPKKEADKVIVKTTDEITIHYDGRIDMRTIR